MPSLCPSPHAPLRAVLIGCIQLVVTLLGLGLHLARAQTGPLTSGDIGAVSAAGSASESAGTFTIRGSGADIWDTADEFHFHRRAWTGDGVFVARVSNVTNTDTWAKAGIMLRATLDPGSPHYLACLNGGGFPARIYRPVPGPSSFTPALESEDRGTTLWVKLIRDGNIVGASYSKDGTTWRSLGNQTTTLPASTYVGLAVTSHADGVLCTATFDQVAFLPLAPTDLTATVRGPNQIDLVFSDPFFRETAFELERSTDGTSFTRITTLPANHANDSVSTGARTIIADRVSYSDTSVVGGGTYHYRVRALTSAGASPYSNTATAGSSAPAPAGWTRLDIGDCNPAGAVSSTSPGTFAISGSGAGVGGVNLYHESTGRGDLSYWMNGVQDAFHFLYQPWIGDGEVVARVSRPAGGSTNAQAGLMVRAGSANNAFNVFFQLRPDGRLMLTARTSTSTNAYNPDNTKVLRTTTLTSTAPTWLKLVRSGGGIMSYTSADGAAWTEFHYVSLPLAAEVQLGLAVSSYQNGTTATATFEGAEVRAITTPLPAPAAPSDLAVTSTGDTYLYLGWTNNTTSYDTFELQRSSDGGATYTSTTLYGPASHYQSGLTNGTTYTFRLRVIRGGVASAFSNTATGTTSGQGGPVNLAATAVSSWRVDLAWTDNATGETGYRVTRGSGFGTDVVIANLPADATSYSDLTTSASTTYSYRVAAVFPSTLTWSNAAHVTTPADGATPPAAPGTLAATATSSSQIALTWTDHATNETGFNLERSTDGATFSLLISLPANTTSYTDAGLIGGQTYHYRVRAALNSVTSAASNTATATTPVSSTPGSWTRTDIGAVGAPGTHSGSGTALSVTGSGADIWENSDEFTYLHQSWTGDGTFAIRALSVDYTHGWAKAGIMLRESLAPTARHVFIAIAAGQPTGLYVRNTAGGSTSLTLSPLETKPMWLQLGRVGNTFHAHYSTDGANWTPLGSPVTLDLPTTFFAGLAVTSHNDGTLARAEFDNVAFTGATGPTPVPLIAPSNLRLNTAAAHDSLRLLWNDNSTNEGGFEVERSTDRINFTRIATTAPNISSYEDRGLTPSTTYYYRVRAVLSSSVSDFSNVLTATTTAPATIALVAPTNLTATALTPRSLQLSWTDNSTGEAYHTIEISDNGTAFRAHSASYGSTSTTISGIPGATYHFRVRAEHWDSTNYPPSGYSNVVTITLPHEPVDNGTWTSQDIGAVAVAGSSSESGGSVAMSASGLDIWNYSDEFHFRHRAWSGNFVFTARVTSLTNTNPWAKAGLMFRESLAPESRHTYVCVTPQHGTSYQSRLATAGESVLTPGSASNALPKWIRLQRSGTSVSAYESADGTTWSLIATRSFSTNVTCYVGFAATSHNDGTLTQATFDNVSLVGDSPDTPPSAASNVLASIADGAVRVTWSDVSSNETHFEVQRGTTGYTFSVLGTVAANVTTFTDTTFAPSTTYLYRIRAVNAAGASSPADSPFITTPAAPPPPPPSATWQHTDVGSVGVAGSDDTSGTNSLIVRGSGADIWENADGFRFLYRVLDGDCTVEAQVTSLTNTHGWAKAGVMIRESLDANSRHASAFVTAANGTVGHSRTATGAGTSIEFGPWGSNAPYWVRLRRTGNTITASSSPNGTTWTILATYTLALPAQVYVGFAVTSHDNTQLATATFTDPFIE